MTVNNDHGRRTSGLIDQVIATLRQHITDHRWPIGTRIPPEPELVELTGVGRNTVREAVQSLVHAGLLERRQGSGTFVIAESEMAVAMGRQIAGARQHDVLEVRLTLEVATARFAAQRRTSVDLLTITRLRDERAAAAADGNLEQMVDRDLELHRAIAVASHNPVLSDLYDNLIEALAENIRFNFMHLSHEDDNHADLINAIIAGDGQAAGRAVSVYFAPMLESTSPEGVPEPE